jgi:hypothetical protein
MAVYGDTEGKTILSMSPGRHFDDEVMYEVQEELARQDIASVSHTYDVEQGNKTIEDHANHRNEAVKKTGAAAMVGFGWSWGLNPEMWPGPDGVPVIKRIFLAGAPHPNTVAWLDDKPEINHPLPYTIFEPKSDKDIHAAVDLLKATILNTVEDEDLILHWAKKINQRPHPRVEGESVLEDAPKEPIDYIVIQGDKAITNQADYFDENHRVWNEGIVTKLSRGVDVTSFKLAGDHGMPISAPKKLAELIACRFMAVTFEPVEVV